MGKGIPLMSFAGSYSRRAVSLSEEVRVTSGVPQGGVLGPLLFLAYVNDIGRNLELNVRFFADDCIIYGKIMNESDIDTLQVDLHRLGEWAIEKGMKQI